MFYILVLNQLYNGIELSGAQFIDWLQVDLDHEFLI